MAHVMAIDPQHSLWSAFLARYVRDGRVDYAAVLKDGMAELEAYLNSLKAVDQTIYQAMSRDDQLAFWLNSYNAYAVKTVLDSFPIVSIQNLDQPFKQPIVEIPAMAPATLDNIEHDIVRVQFDDPRVHFALVCSSESCPSLRGEAYTGASLETQLEDQTRRFLVDRSKNRVENGALHLSQIFAWYERDFENEDSLRNFVARYLGEAAGKLEIRYLDYDWRLNDVR